jgi:hypothetical protein
MVVTRSDCGCGLPPGAGRNLATVLSAPRALALAAWPSVGSADAVGGYAVPGPGCAPAPQVGSGDLLARQHVHRRDPIDDQPQHVRSSLRPRRSSEVHGGPRLVVTVRQTGSTVLTMTQFFSPLGRS